MLKRFPRPNGKSIYVNTDAITLIDDHPTNTNMAIITLACGTKFNVYGNKEWWAERLEEKS